MSPDTEQAPWWEVVPEGSTLVAVDAEARTATFELRSGSPEDLMGTWVIELTPSIDLVRSLAAAKDYIGGLEAICRLHNVPADLP